MPLPFNPAQHVIEEELQPNPEQDLPLPGPDDDEHEEIDPLDQRYWMYWYKLKGTFWDGDLDVCFHLRPVQERQVLASDKVMRKICLCCYNSQVTDCGYSELYIERQRRRAVRLPLKFPFISIQFMPGHRPHYLIPPRIFVASGYVDPAYIDRANQVHLGLMGVGNVPLPEPDDTPVQDEPAPVLQPAASQLPAVQPAVQPAAAHRTQSLPVKLHVQKPMQKPKPMVISDDNYDNEDDETKERLLLQWFCLPEGVQFAAPFLRELLQDLSVLTRAVSKRCLQEMGGLVTDCGYSELYIERQRRRAARLPLKFPFISIRFMPGHCPHYLIPPRIFVASGYVDPAYIDRANQVHLGLMGVGNVPLPELDDTPVQDEPAPVPQPAASQLPAVQPAVQPAAAHRTQSLPVKLHVQKPMQKPKPMVISDDNYDNEDDETKERLLLQWFCLPEGVQFAAPFLRELLQDSSVLTRAVSKRCLQEMGGLGMLPARQRKFRPQHDAGKALRMDDQYDCIVNSTVEGLSRSDELPVKQAFIRDLMRLEPMHRYHATDKVQWAKMVRVIEDMMNIFARGKDARDMDESCETAAQRRESQLIWDELIAGEPELHRRHKVMLLTVAGSDILLYDLL
ncbi:hypothetical protein CALVIDRAFT_559907 [Calocera viscosa TUFC12733]|uniref:Uncharacterized protein n=1 Tax=Calocera viscosa (strain TUFC12733) TaxID=1330018 RepID=A0A167RU39_CALVF|nr:hypothetical protein CALVIDRAFT_559907 [Calocera viscosa TUFC12733]